MAILYISLWRVVWVGLFLLFFPIPAFSHISTYSCVTSPALPNTDIEFTFDILASEMQDYHLSTVTDDRYAVIPLTFVTKSIRGRTDASGVAWLMVECDQKNNITTVQNMTCSAVVDDTAFDTNFLLGFAGIVCGGLVAYTFAKAAQWGSND